MLFLCTGNSCRSQMAEGFARAAYGDRLDACSAGTRPQGLNRLAVRAMAEVGIDLTTHANSTIDDCDPQTIDLVITVCGHAHETCPVFPGRTPVVHRGFDDPPALAAAAGATSDEDAMPHFRRVRDEIRAAVEALPALLRAHVIPTRGVTP
ncbi:MAG: arsenate reductase ArsC [Phycisphaerales bacterium]|nr:arsenate reductase ArsC [Phycisphaerales bacterium]